MRQHFGIILYKTRDLDPQPFKMIRILVMLGTVIPFCPVEGRTGCWAGPPGSQGNICIQNTTVPGHISNDIRYSFISRYTHICCDVLACTDFRGCRLKEVGCFQGMVLSQRIPWELRDIHPLVSCSSSNQPGYYQFEIHA
ncbi:insoluble matrix shell protein 3-like [Ruditapes philippinarum]|uniref:insoluble matrix shell protein 3-like n=1 Tax=Ruditapes philippinarum TaxID=129788 RepID=UPI00295B6837|nr:insoluble matrix shell protein 3-like [Ruditapes philippinarum]